MSKTPRLRYRYRHWIFRLPWMKPYSAICLGRIICFREEESKVSARILAHELVHQEQMTQYGVVRFYWLYLVDYFRNLIRYRNHYLAYREIRFEKEAYEKEQSASRT